MIYRQRVYAGRHGHRMAKSGESFTSKPRSVDKLNRIVLPQEALVALGVKTGDHVVVEVEAGVVRVVAVDWKKRS